MPGILEVDSFTGGWDVKYQIRPDSAHRGQEIRVEPEPERVLRTSLS